MTTEERIKALENQLRCLTLLVQLLCRGQVSPESVAAGVEVLLSALDESAPLP